MSARLPKGVSPDDMENRFVFYRRSGRSYGFLILIILGLAGPIALFAGGWLSTGANVGISVPLWLLMLASIYSLWRYKWSKAFIQFDTKQVSFTTAAFPLIWCASTSMTVPITSLSHIRVEISDYTRGGAKQGIPYFAIEIVVKHHENGKIYTDFIPLDVVCGHHFIVEVVKPWEMWLAEKGYEISSNGSDFTDMSAQLLAIAPQKESSFTAKKSSSPSAMPTPSSGAVSSYRKIGK